MEGSDVCLAPVLTIAEVMAYPHNRARGTFIEVDGVIQPAPAPRFSRSVPEQPHAPVPAKEEDAATFASWGFAAQDIVALRTAGVFGRSI